MKQIDQVRWLQVCAVTVALSVCALAVGATTTPRSAPPLGNSAHARTSARPKQAVQPLERFTLAAELKDLYSSRGVIGETAKELTDTPGMPACAPPALPAATYPPGKSYGIPFLAAITNGQILAGYDEWTANNTHWLIGEKIDHLYPWQNKISDITGWVTGLLQLPNLSATVAPQDVVFCDQGGVSCVSGNPPPAGECIHIFTQYGPSPGKGNNVPPPPITNYPPPGTSCWDATGCLAIVVSLTPSGDTSLTVTGVEPDGALDLLVKTAAVTTATQFPPGSTTGFACSNAATAITLSTEEPASLPMTAPPMPISPNRDDRFLQTAPQPLTGPLATASSTLAGNDFAIQAFLPSTSSSGPCYNAGAVPLLLNTYTGGWGIRYKDQIVGLYYLNGGTSPIVAQPGWAQFTATTSVVTLGLPVGPPPNFHL